MLKKLPDVCVCSAAGEAIDGREVSVEVGPVDLVSDGLIHKAWLHFF